MLIYRKNGADLWQNYPHLRHLESRNTRPSSIRSFLSRKGMKKKITMLELDLYWNQVTQSNVLVRYWTGTTVSGILMPALISPMLMPAMHYILMYTGCGIVFYCISNIYTNSMGSILAFDNI
jgi:hypothetical protein